MDTKTFLLERDEICQRLQHKRYTVTTGHSRTPDGFLGLSWGDLSQLVFSLGGGRGMAAWLPRILLTAAAPIFATFFRGKMEEFASSGSMFRRVLNLFAKKLA